MGSKRKWNPEFFSLDGEFMKKANDLLSDLIQIKTVNTGEVDSGNEIEAAKYCEKILNRENFKNIKIIESEPGRGSIICKWKGKDQNAPKLCLLGHLDVVPANEKQWEREPFCGDIEEEYIWGRGAIDCKGLVASELMAALFLKREGYQPEGDIILAFTADEESGGEYGLGYVAEHHWDEIKADLTINEGGGILLPLSDQPKDYIVQIGEKGVFWTKLKVHGKGGHGSMPIRKEKSALYKLAMIIEKITEYKPPIEITHSVERMLDKISLPGIAKRILKTKWLIRPVMNIARKFLGDSIPQVVMPLLTDVISPTGLKGSEKVNIIPQTAELDLDCRLLPDHDRKTIEDHLRKAIGKDLYQSIEIEEIPPTQPATVNQENKKLWNFVESVIENMHEGANLVPMLSAGSTDSKYIRERGGYSLGFFPMMMDPNMSYEEMNEMVHGKNERMWIPNYAYAIEFFVRLMRNF